MPVERTKSKVTARMPAAAASQSSSMVIRSLEGIESLRTLWGNLLSGEAAPFQTFGWNLAWYRHYGDAYDEICVFVSSNQRAVFPMFRRGNFLRFAGDQICDYQDVIATDPAHARAGFEELLDWSRSRGLSLQLSRLSTAGLLYPIVQDQIAWTGWYEPVEKTLGPCPTFTVRQSAEETLNHLPRKYRAEIRRQGRRLESDFPGVKLEVTRAPDNQIEQLDRMVEFHRSQFARVGVNPLEDGRFVKLLSEICNDPDVGFRLARMGNEETTMAEDFTFVRGRRFYGFLMAFNREYARYSPGTVMLRNRLERLVKAGVETFDFLCGPEEYKYRFATDEYFVRSVHLFPKTANGWMNWARLKGDYSLRNVAKWALVKLGLREAPGQRRQQ